MRVSLKKTVAIACISSMLTGCASSTPLFEDVKKEDVQELATYAYGSTAIEKLIINKMISLELKNEWKQEVKDYADKSFKEMKENEESYKAYVKSLGYESLEEYKEKELETSAEQFVVIKHHILDTEGLYESYTPVKIRYVLYETQEEAQAVCDQLALGVPFMEVVGDRETQETVLTSAMTEMDTTVVSTIYNNEGTYPVNSIDMQGQGYMVYEITSREQEDLIETVVTSFLTDETKVNAYLRDLAKKYKLEIHDDLVYNFMLEDSAHLLWEVKTDEEKANDAMKAQLEKTSDVVDTE